MNNFTNEDRQGFLDGIKEHVGKAIGLLGDITMGVDNAEGVRPDLYEQLAMAMTCVQGLTQQERAAGNLGEPRGQTARREPEVENALGFVTATERAITAALESAGCEDGSEGQLMLEAMARALRNCRYIRRELGADERRIEVES